MLLAKLQLHTKVHLLRRKENLAEKICSVSCTEKHPPKNGLSTTLTIVQIFFLKGLEVKIQTCILTVIIALLKIASNSILFILANAMSKKKI